MISKFVELAGLFDAAKDVRLRLGHSHRVRNHYFRRSTTREIEFGRIPSLADGLLEPDRHPVPERVQR
jgi:hypothetical protein